MRWTQGLKVVFAFCFALLVTIAAFDLIAYWTVPSALTGFAPDYRKKTYEAASMPHYARGYPQGYFRTDDLLGFDIRESTGPVLYTFLDARVEIFSNDIGCFDRHNLETIRSNASYDYFAGDSFTWGYADYDKKFATVYERETARFTVKCGVTHTGQLHQFDKFKNVVKAVGRYPKRVVVGYVANDPANDFAHPHATVINGFLVDTVEFFNGHLVGRDMTKVEDAIERWVEAQSSKPKAAPHAASVKDYLKKYSLSVNLIKFGRSKLRKHPSNQVEDRPKNIYELNRHVDFQRSYSTSPYTRRNREAILKWADDARRNAYRLYFVLIPPRASYDDVEYYAGLKRFLRDEGIAFIDMAVVFRQSSKSAQDLYWPSDGHWNNEGNQFVGQRISTLID